jgi:hypothetical protein
MVFTPANSAAQEREQIDFSSKSELAVLAAHRDQIVLFFYGILCVGQLSNSPAGLFV